MKSYSSDLPNIDKLRGKFRIAYALIIANVLLTAALILFEAYDRFPTVRTIMEQYTN
jgi:hypothetical protein